jgi:hypothetical protein
MMLAGAAVAQPGRAPESITVTGTRERAVLDKFVQGFAAPTRMTGKLARWEDGICPSTIGLGPRYAAFVTKHVRDVAKEAGAPVSADPACRPNIHIVFTTNPQGLIDNIKKNQPGFLGYYDNNAQRNALATVSRPIQAWYTTATRDLRGNVQVDSGKTVGTGMEITYACPPPQEGMCTMRLSNAHGGSVTGSRLGDGMRSTFHTVIITAQPDKLLDQEIGTLADYIALLALSQIHVPEGCQPLSSIISLLSEGCADKASALTENDRGYLKGLYRMGTERTLRTQQDEIAWQMEQTLNGK